MGEYIKALLISRKNLSGEMAGQKSNYRPNPAMYISIFGVWIAAVFWFHPRMLMLYDMVDGPLQWMSISFFIVFVELAWLYGFFNAGVVLFAWLYRKTSKPQIAPMPAREALPPVAVLYTTCNDFVEESARSCVVQNYPRFTVYILDDSSDPSYKKRIESFAEEHGDKVSVIRRPDRRAFKAGNMNHALEKHVREPFFAIADADEILPPDFLSRMLPEIMYDSEIGFIQANHRSNPKQESSLARSLGMGVDIHWRWYQPLRNRFGFVMFLGHGAVLRRICWEKIGGFPEIVSEDLGFAIRIREYGYRGKFVEHVVCYEDFPEDIRSFRIRHIKWTRGTCEFLLKEGRGLIRSRAMSWAEKCDILFPTLNLPLTLFYFLFMVNANIFMPLLFGRSQPVTAVIGGSEWVFPAVVFQDGFASIFSTDFFLITLLTFFAPVLSFVVELIRKPLTLLRFLSHSTAVYAALSPLSAIGVISFLSTRKATFLVTGDKQQSAAASSAKFSLNGIGRRIREVLQRSHPDQPEVQLFEILTGAAFVLLCLFLIQISFLGLALAFVFLPVMHHFSWDNQFLRKIVYLPFAIIILGLLIGSLSVFGMQTVFFGYGFHF